MPSDCISYKETGYFSRFILDYLEECADVKPLYGYFPVLENFKKQLEDKSGSYPENHRKVLVEQLETQYQGASISMLTQKNIQSLKSKNTFTVTTGHQLNLFTGPLYFLYKIVSTINLCKQLKQAYPACDFVPVYWMATEDHDFEEIDYFNFQGKKVVWQRESSGAVGRLDTKGLADVAKTFSKVLGNSANAQKLQSLFSEAYLKHDKLASATRFLVNELFGKFGLVIMDADNTELKKLFAPYVKEELRNKTSFKSITETNEFLVQKKYTIQVNPREINLFYLAENLRERIIEKDGRYFVNNSNLSFSQEELFKEVDNHPERFSPNVMLRPLYQEVILPNLCYIGGGGEIAYWLQLKKYFNDVKTPFPVLLLRNSALLVPEKMTKKVQNLSVSTADLFLSQEELKTRYVRQISEIDIDFSLQKEHLKKQFEALYLLANKTDKSFIGAVSAQEKKQIKGLENLEKRLLKAQKRQFSDKLNHLILLQNELFPNGNLQERTHNFSEWYLEYGEELIPKLMEVLNPLDLRFTIIDF